MNPSHHSLITESSATGQQMVARATHPQKRSIAPSSRASGAASQVGTGFRQWMHRRQPFEEKACWYSTGLTNLHHQAHIKVRGVCSLLGTEWLPTVHAGWCLHQEPPNAQ